MDLENKEKLTAFVQGLPRYTGQFHSKENYKERKQRHQQESANQKSLHNHYLETLKNNLWLFF